MKVHAKRSVARPQVTTDGESLVSQAGVGLLAELADRSELTGAMSWAMAECGISWHTHDPGVVLTHVAVAIANGADCLSDVAVLRAQPELFDPIASQATVWRALRAATSVELRRIPRALAQARQRVWDAAGMRAESGLTLDFDATLVTAHSDKEDAAPTYKRGFGFHPLGVWADGPQEPLAAMLRPGNAGSNSAADHVVLLGEAIDALPEPWRAGHRPGDDPGRVICPMLVRADSAGATHWFVEALVERNIDYSIGYSIDGRVRDALLLVQEEDWVSATEPGGQRRQGAYVVEVTDLVNLAGWPQACRLIVRRERPHPGAQLSLFDTAEGWRHTAFITSTPGSDIAALELRHRGHARVEDRVRAWKDCGLANLPFESYTRNQAWTALTLLAQCLLSWTQNLCLDGLLARAEPKTLRQRLLHVAARLAHRHRQLYLHIDATWPWNRPLVGAYQRLRLALPDP